MAALGVTSSSIDTAPLLNVTTSPARITQNTTADNVLLTFGILRMQKTESSLMPPFKDAHECSLKWCVKAYDSVSTTWNSPLDYMATSTWDIAVPPGPPRPPTQDNLFRFGEGWWENFGDHNGGRDAQWIAMDIVNDNGECTSAAELIHAHVLKYY